MNRSISKLLLLAAAVSSVGCAAKFNGQEHALTIAEEHPISVDSQTVTMTISDSPGELSALDRSRVRAFAGAYMNNGHGVISVTAPASGSGAVASVRQALYDAGVPWASMADAA
ncbi:MAG: CpaD family pilus assembly lipoprotein, partial [Pseudomonadota bacterium]